MTYVSFAPQTILKGRVTILMLACLAVASTVTGRAIYIQLIRDSRIENLARRQFQAKVLIRPRRGSILDRTGEPLAVSVETQSLAANPAKIPNKRTLASLLARSIDQPVLKVLEKIREKREFVWLKRHLTENEIARLKRLHLLDSTGNMAHGLWLVKESKRVYPHGELAAHVMGDVNVDSEGLEGVELWANERLQGKIVSVTAIKDALGRPTFIDADAANGLQEGEPVQLTLDASLQYAVEQELKNSITKTGSRAGSVIVMNAITGEILALANAPSFNPNDKNLPADHRRNRALTDGFEPGSIMKPILLSSALSHGWKLTDRVWGEQGFFTLQGKTISEAEQHEKFEWLSLKKIIQVSSNIGAAKLALRVGPDFYSNTLRTFGFGTKTDTGFPGEISGRVLPRKGWTPLALANIGFGQGILVTPIQMLRAYSAFANGGWLVQPTLLKTPLKGLTPSAPHRIMNRKTVEGVVEALLSVTEEGGTGLKARVEGYRVAGKTGTAQTVDPTTGKYSHNRYNVSFVGFAVGVEPKIVIFAGLNEPRGSYYASETAAPLFSAVLNAVATRFSLPAMTASTPHAQFSPMNDQIQWSLAKTTEPNRNESEIQWQGTTPEGGEIWKMPTLHNFTAREALRTLQGHKFQLEIHGSGLVRAQVPEPGKPIADGTTIRLILAGP